MNAIELKKTKVRKLEPPGTLIRPSYLSPMVFYDAGGNPTLLRGVPLTWGEGRRLKKVSLSWGTVDFAYDSDGKRVKKTSGNTETKYYYNGSTLIGLVKTTTGSTGTTKTTVQFVYDAEGKPFMLRLNGKTDYSLFCFLQ